MKEVTGKSHSTPH